MNQTQNIVRVTQLLVEGNHTLDQCYLCGASIPRDGCPLCTVCELDQREKWDDYLTEQQQKRRPL